ncbi:MAG: hypothetical protein C0601_03080 [Candidatus Muiribacterium halophilum]|uniref:Shikimate dehydrogenase substrate binding N-terminal domain-containing protein n=1 Tax=Muiribacterium halophilum TaxID=2053465 RepID=A0A2N5ZJX5_MUIH1|nr:MAG: hypothetical protein C0601_03080 [Candidatus Muirbacterium halophilum]
MSTRSLFLIGNNISHSLSYKIYGYLFKKYDINMIYSNIDINPLGAKSFLSILPCIQNITGLNATYPYKQLLLEYGEADNITNEIGGANILYYSSDKIKVDNTDGPGIVNFVKRYKIKTNRIAILGTGITARAFSYNLLKRCDLIDVYSREPNKVNNKSFFSEKGIVIKDYNELCTVYYDIIFNVTPVSFEALDLKETINCGKLFDVNYNCLNYDYFNGIYLLIEQALINFRIWTGIDADCEYKQLFELLTGEN